jgi:hypothetical protein
MREQTLRAGQSVTVGNGRRDTFAGMIGGEGSYTLIQAAGNSCSVLLTEGMVATIHRKAGKPDVLRSGTATFAEEDWGMIEHGEVTYYFQWVQPEKAVFGGLFGSENEYMATFAISFFVHLALMILALASLPKVPMYALEDEDQRLVQVEVNDPSSALEELEEEDVPDDETTSAAAGGEEGRFGEEDALVEESVLPDRDGPLVDQLTTTELGMAIDSAIGVSGALSNVFGQTNNFADTFGADFATAGTGDAFVVGRGVGGMGMRGMGRGGGGDGLGRVHGVGGIDTGSGRGQGAALGRRGEREPRAQARVGAPQTSGFCSREMLERTVRRHNRGIRFCYERELQNDRSLSGRVTAQWTVGLDGSVISANITENSMNNRNMESCMIAEIRRMRFDRPDGGQCIVSFPFTFRSE